MSRIALLFDRTYIDAHYCFSELAIRLADSGYSVDLYYIRDTVNYQPFFENPNIRLLPFPQSRFEFLEYWSKIMYSKDRKYDAIIATPIKGAWLAYQTARLRKVPYYYLADELLDHLVDGLSLGKYKKEVRKNYLSNKNAIATIALGEDRYSIQKGLNRIDFPHDHIVIPNAPAGKATRLRSHYFADLFQIEDRKPIILFAGTLDWRLAKKIYEETKNYGEKNYHLIFHTRSTGKIQKSDHPFIKISSVPLPAGMVNYAVSSADIGLALYDKNSEHETRNGITAGKIGTYLKNELPLIAGSAENLKIFEQEKVGTYWDGNSPFDSVANKAINNLEVHRKYIPEYYKRNLQYEIFFEDLKKHLSKIIK
jgi:hypothetical protein